MALFLCDMETLIAFLNALHEEGEKKPIIWNSSSPKQGVHL